MKHRKFILQTSLGPGGLLPVVNSLKAFYVSLGQYLSTGIKIGGVTPTSVIVWIRLTKDTKPVGKQALIPDFHGVIVASQSLHQ